RVPRLAGVTARRANVDALDTDAAQPAVRAVFARDRGRIPVGGRPAARAGEHRGALQFGALPLYGHRSVTTAGDRPAGPFPGGARFAFTVMDDTDVATVENIRPIYRLFESLGMRTTKTVWPVACPEGSR